MTVQPLNLRPLSAGEVLDRAFRLYRAHFGLFIGIAGVLLVPLLVLELALEATTKEPAISGEQALPNPEQRGNDVP